MIAKLVFKTWLGQFGMASILGFIPVLWGLLDLLIVPKKKKKKREAAKHDIALMGIGFAIVAFISIPYMIDMITQNTEQKLAEVMSIDEPEESGPRYEVPLYAYDVMIDGKEKTLYSLDSYALELNLQEGETYDITYCQCTKLIVKAEIVETEILLE